MNYFTPKPKQHSRNCVALYNELSSNPAFEEDSAMDMLSSISKFLKIIEMSDVNQTHRTSCGDEKTGESENGLVSNFKPTALTTQDYWAEVEEDDSFHFNEIHSGGIEYNDYDDETFPDYSMMTYDRVKNLSAQQSVF